MNDVANQFGIEDNKREHWKSTYKHVVRDALNNRRNNTAQDLKKELIGMYDLVCYDAMLQDHSHHNTCFTFIALRKEFPGIYEAPDIFINVCTCDATANFEPFWLFFDQLIAKQRCRKENLDQQGQGWRTHHSRQQNLDSG
jgi:hypothetical protein